MRGRVPEVLDAIPVDDDPAQVGATSQDSDPDGAGTGRIEVGPQRGDHIVRPIGIREVLRREHDVA